MIVVLDQDHHRNGSGGDGFVATLFSWDDAGFPAYPQDRWLAISRCLDGEIESPEELRESFVRGTAVLNLRLLNGDHPVTFARGNSWRGADYCGPTIAAAWHENYKASHRPDSCAWETSDGRRCAQCSPTPVAVEITVDVAPSVARSLAEFLDDDETRMGMTAPEQEAVTRIAEALRAVGRSE